MTEVTINAMSVMNLASMFFRAGEGRGPRAAALVYSANILPDSIEFIEFCVTAGKRRHLPNTATETVQQERPITFDPRNHSKAHNSENTARRLVEAGVIAGVNVCKELANRRWRVKQPHAEKIHDARNHIAAESTREDVASLISLMRFT